MGFHLTKVMIEKDKENKKIRGHANNSFAIICV